MADVVTEIENSFKRLVKTKRLRGVTVKDICSGAHVSRNTFYANYVDKRAVLAKIFRTDVIEPIQHINSLLPPEEAVQISPAIIARFYQGVFENRDFYCDIVPSTGPDEPDFILIVARAVYDLTVQSIKRLEFRGSEQELHNAAYFYSSAQAITLTEWIAKRYKTPIEELAELQAQMIVPFWAERTGITPPSQFTIT